MCECETDKKKKKQSVRDSKGVIDHLKSVKAEPIFPLLLLSPALCVDVFLLIKVRVLQGPCHTHVALDDMKADSKLFW